MRSKRAQAMVQELTQEAELDRVYLGKVKRITDFGAFVEIFPGTDGLIHISHLAEGRVEKVTDVVSEGDEVLAKCIDIDPSGRIRLSRKEALADAAAKRQTERGGGARPPRVRGAHRAPAAARRTCRFPRAPRAGAAGFDLRAGGRGRRSCSRRARARSCRPASRSASRGLRGAGAAAQRPRAAHGIVLPNAPGTIDSDYRGEVRVIVLEHRGRAVQIRRGDRIAQLVIAPVARAEWEEARASTRTARGDGGFGHTGARRPERGA